jgi:HAD superfamily hydrolase (TIGR01509 family)
MTRAMIFDCDGVLVDTERAGHLPAFNALFAHLGLPVRWDEADYAELLHITGGKERMRTLLTPDFVRLHRLPRDAEGQNQLLAAWHKWKTAYYTDLVESGALPGRTGVARLTRAALDAGWKVAVASTSAEPAVRANLRAAVGDLADRVSVFAGDLVAHKKPAPDIYLYTLDRLGVSAADAVVIEDSGIGVRSACAAGLATLVTVSAFTAAEDFTGAAAILEDLGEPASPARVLSDPAGLVPDGVVTIATLKAVMDRTVTVS